MVSQQLSVANELIGNVVDPTWLRYVVPASNHLPVLRKKAREEWSVPVLMSADRLSVTQQAARQKVASAGAKLFGDWPL